MARTGSGKTLAYLIPLIQRLNGRHTHTVGVKSLILCPSRELALQILKVGKEIARGWKSDNEGGQSEAIRWALIVGGEGLDEQFALMATNPDVVIATPGRLLHLAVEMNLDLKAVQYVVFDEADRLFEMGFAAQLQELLDRLPINRQTLLFSATLPKSLVDFARAGLQENPKLVRLDADSKISSELRMSFFSVKPSEKEAALLILLRDVIGVPLGEQRRPDEGGDNQLKKRKRRAQMTGADDLLPHQTIIFCATKHHVEYLLLLLGTAGYSCSHIYSSLDQAARGIEMKRFREGTSSLLIVTDVAARGIDLPVLEHVVNYDFPGSPRVFVHRVGRTARAGRRGWAWSLFTANELPFLCDLQLFLARPLVSTPKVEAELSSRVQAEDEEGLDLHGNLVVGTFARDTLDNETEYITGSLTNANSAVSVALPALKQVVGRAQKLYERSQAKASQESYRRAKSMAKDSGGKWALAGSASEDTTVHDVLMRPRVYGLTPLSDAGARPVANTASSIDKDAAARAALLAKVNGFTPVETVFEVGARGATPNALLMKDRRKTLAGKAKRAQIKESLEGGGGDEEEEVEDSLVALKAGGEIDMADEDEIRDTFDTTADPASSSNSKKQKRMSSYKDPEFYMSYEQKDANTERGYSLQNGDGNFVEQARNATFSLGGNDEGKVARFGVQSQAPNQARWDVKKKKFIKGDGTGSDNQKIIRTESGTKLPASFRSGRFDEWRKKQRMDLPKVGEREDDKVVGTARGLAGVKFGHQGGGSGQGGYRHKMVKEAKRPSDRLAKDYKSKMERFKQRTEGEGAGSRGEGPRKKFDKGPFTGGKGGKDKKSGVRRTGRGARSELKSASQIQKERALAEKRKEKNARPSKKGGGGGRGKAKSRR